MSEARVAMVTVILPCRNEADRIDACLESIAATTFPIDRLEVLVIDGQSDDGSRQIVQGYVERHPWMRLLDNPRRITPAALNLGIRGARGEIVLRMDAHAVYPPEYITRMVAALQESGAENVGCRVLTVPGGPGPVAHGIALALSHRFGVGNSYFRIGAGAPRWVDTVAFGCFRRQLFARIGLFDEELVRNQDDEFNGRLRRAGGRILLLPDLTVTYPGRATLQQVARMFYQYGRFKPLAALKVGRLMTLRQIVPAAFLASLVLTGVTAPMVPAAALAWCLLVASYAAAAGTAALGIPGAGLRCRLALLAALVTMHLSYGLGYWLGLYALAVGRWRVAQPAQLPLSR